MRARIVAALGLAGLAGVAVWFFWPRPERTSPAPEASPLSVADASIEPGASLTCDLSGTVSRGSERLEGATVRLLFLDDGGSREVLSRKGGTFSFAALPAGWMRITARAGGDEDVASVYAEAPAECPGGVELDVSDAAELAGRVRDRAGHPLAGIIVEVQSNSGEDDSPTPIARTETDPDGGFRFRTHQPGDYTCMAYGDGFATTQVQTDTLELRKVVYREVVLEPEVLVSGTVFDSLGQPVNQAELNAQGDDLFSTIESSDADGGFVIHGLTPGRYDLYVDHPGFLAATVELSAPSAAVRVTLSKGATLEGEVQDERGESLFPMQVVLAQWDAGALMPFQTTEADAAGRFAFQALPPGEYEAKASRGDHEGRPSAVNLKGERIERVHLYYERGLALSGTVVDPQGQPIESWVNLRSDRIGIEMTQLSMRTLRGAFAFDRLAPGRYHLRASTGGFDQREEVPAEAGAAHVVLRLSPLPRAIGRVLLPTGTPAKGFTLYLNRAMSQHDSPDGRFEEPISDTGPIRVEAVQETLKVVRPSLVIEGGHDLELGDLVLEPPHGVTLTVIDASNSHPLMGARVVLPRMQETSTDAQGNAQIDVTGGEVPVSVSQGGYVPESLMLGAAATVRLHPYSRIVGTVTGPRGAPVAAATVYVDTEHGHVCALTDGNGYYELGGLRPGRYDVQVPTLAWLLPAVIPCRGGGMTRPGDPVHSLQLGIDAVEEVNFSGVVLLLPGDAGR